VEGGSAVLQRHEGYGDDVSYMWLLPTAVFIVGAIAVGRLVGDISREARLAEIDLAEAAEALIIVAENGTELNETSQRIEDLVDAIASPRRALGQARRTARHWWSRARRSSRSVHVPSEP